MFCATQQRNAFLRCCVALVSRSTTYVAFAQRNANRLPCPPLGHAVRRCPSPLSGLARGAPRVGLALLISADEANVMSPCWASRWYMSPIIFEKFSPRASRAALRCHDMAATFCPFHRQERGGICRVYRVSASRDRILRKKCGPARGYSAPAVSHYCACVIKWLLI